jgi:hypothetical protein
MFESSRRGWAGSDEENGPVRATPAYTEELAGIRKGKDGGFVLGKAYK